MGVAQQVLQDAEELVLEAMVLGDMWVAILGEVQAMLRCMAEAKETITSASVMAHTEGLEKTEEATGAGVAGETTSHLEALCRKPIAFFKTGLGSPLTHRIFTCLGVKLDEKNEF